MSIESKQKYVLEVVENILGKKINPADYVKKMEDIGIDSVIFIKTVVQCETSLNFTFEDDKLLITEFENLNDFVAYIIKKSADR
jgi:acyl carrier protein